VGSRSDFDWREHRVRRLVVRRLGGDDRRRFRRVAGATAELKLAVGEHRSLPC